MSRKSTKYNDKAACLCSVFCCDLLRPQPLLFLTLFLVYVLFLSNFSLHVQIVYKLGHPMSDEEVRLFFLVAMRMEKAGWLLAFLSCIVDTLGGVGGVACPFCVLVCICVRGTCHADCLVAQSD